MKKTALIAGVALTVLTAGAGALGAMAAGSPQATAALKVDNFMLADQDYLAHELYRMKDAKAVVLIATAASDPALKGGAPAYKAVKTALAGKGAEVFLLDAAAGDNREGLAKAAGAVDMPVLFDNEQLVGEQLGVTRAGEAVVIDPKTWKVAYRGPASGVSAAVEAVSAGRTVAVAQAQVLGPLIAFPARLHSAEFAKISYAHDIAPMIQQKCAVCHQAGGIGPMPLTNYEQIKGFAPMIREVLRTKRMPPYMADETVGHFEDDKRLSPDQIKTMVHWIEAGAPRGTGADPLTQVNFSVAEWPLGKPDLVIDVPAYQIPAQGIVDYQHPIVANPVTQPMWLRASTVKVTDRQAVHHVLTGLISAADMPKSLVANNEGSEGRWGASVGTYAVGSESEVAPLDHGTLIVPGGGIGFQDHYTPYGKATSEKTQVAWYFYKPGEVPKYVMHNVAIANPAIMIGPNEEFHKEQAYLEFPHDAVVYGAFPHAHYRGGSATTSIRYPDGHEVLLLALPKYNFNWQREYTFATPLKVPAGSKIVTRFTYDNSIRNPANPDHNRTVPWGDQSFDEMLYTKLRYSWVDETSAKLKPGYDRELAANRLVGIFDTDMDGKISMAELKGQPGEGLKAKFAVLDRDHDGKLDKAELAMVANMMERHQRTAEAPTPPAAAKPAAGASAAPAKAVTTAAR